MGQKDDTFKYYTENEVLALPFMVGTLVNDVFMSRSKTFYGCIVFGLRIKYTLFWFGQ